MERTLIRFQKWKVLERSQRVIPYLYAIGGSKGSIARTPVSAAGFQLEGNLCHFDKLHNITQRLFPTVPGDKESEIVPSLSFAGTSLVLVNAV